MRYNELGNTGRKVSALSLGGAQFGIYNDASNYSIKTGAEVVRFAYDHGINYFDTAPWYGYDSGHSERTIGEGLRGLDRSSYFLASKIGRYGKDWAGMFDHSAVRTEASVKTGLERFGVEYIDSIQIHDFEYLESADVILSETLPMLQRLREQGLIRYIGLASYKLPLIKQIIETSPVKIDTVINHGCLTLIDQELRDYMPFFKSRRIGVINGSPLAHGFLMDRELASWTQAAPPDLITSSRKAVKLCREAGFKIERLAIGYSAQECQKEGVATILTGPDSKEQFLENLSLCTDGLSAAESEFCERLRKECFADLSEHNWVNRDIPRVQGKVAAAKKAKAEGKEPVIDF